MSEPVRDGGYKEDFVVSLGLFGKPSQDSRTKSAMRMSRMLYQMYGGNFALRDYLGESASPYDARTYVYDPSDKEGELTILDAMGEVIEKVKVPT